MPFLWRQPRHHAIFDVRRPRQRHREGIGNAVLPKSSEHVREFGDLSRLHTRLQLLVYLLVKRILWDENHFCPMLVTKCDARLLTARQDILKGPSQRLNGSFLRDLEGRVGAGVIADT